VCLFVRLGGWLVAVGFFFCSDFFVFLFFFVVVFSFVCMLVGPCFRLTCERTGVMPRLMSRRPCREVFCFVPRRACFGLLWGLDSPVWFVHVNVTGFLMNVSPLSRCYL